MKKAIIILIPLTIIVLISIIIINKFLLNSNEKEVLQVLKDLDYSLQNISPTEESYISLKPTKPTTLKEYISNIYEVRKYTAENGNLVFYFKVTLKNSYETILMVSNGELISSTFDISYLEKSNDNNDSNSLIDNITQTAYKTIISNMNKLITDKWNESATLNNINFEKILSEL